MTATIGGSVKTPSGEMVAFITREKRVATLSLARAWASTDRASRSVIRASP